MSLTAVSHHDIRGGNNSFPASGAENAIKMRQCAILNFHRTSAFAAVSSVALLTALLNCSDADVDDRLRLGQHGQGSKLPIAWQQQWHTLRNKRAVGEVNLLNNINHGAYKTRLRSSIATCEAALNRTASSSPHASNNIKQELSMQGMDYYYMKMNPDDMFEESTLDSHAVFGPLLGTHLIERFNVYKRVNTSQAKGQPEKNEIAVVDVKVGTRLNGHGGVVHGGIISLLIDTALGFAYHICLNEDKEHIAVTANLKVDFRAPLREGSEAVVRVYLDRIEGRKIFFSVVLESKDGSVVFAEATSLFIKIDRSKVIVNNK